VSNLFNNKYFIEALTLLKESDPNLFMETVFRLIANNKNDLLENQEANDVLGALTQMIQYFESTERQEFEKCAEIKTWMDEIKED
jgi:hypothetical protein